MAKFDLERLKGKKVAVNCVTEEQAQNFIKWVASLGAEKDSINRWKWRKELSYYSLDNDLLWWHGRKEFYKQEGYKIISFEEALLKEDKPKKISKRKKIKNLHKIEIPVDISIEISLVLGEAKEGLNKKDKK